MKVFVDQDRNICSTEYLMRKKLLYKCLGHKANINTNGKTTKYNMKITNNNDSSNINNENNCTNENISQPSERQL